MTLDDAIKLTVLEAIVAHDYDLETAADALAISRMTIYRMFKRWGLTTPLAGGTTSNVLWRDYVERCRLISNQINTLRATVGNLSV